MTGVRIQRPAAACMFKFNPRGRVLVRPRASALPGTVAAAPIACFGANPFVLIVGLTAVSADSRGKAAPILWPSTIIKWDFAKIICGIWRCFFAL